MCKCIHGQDNLHSPPKKKIWFLIVFPLPTLPKKYVCVCININIYIHIHIYVCLYIYILSISIYTQRSNRDVDHYVLQFCMMCMYPRSPFMGMALEMSDRAPGHEL